jgi:hypothetical protein
LLCDKIAIAILKGRASEMGKYKDYIKSKFGDLRLSKRLVKLLEQLSGNPEARISAACKDSYQAKAAYRFLANDEVTDEAITEVTRDVTIANINASKPPVILIPQDTTSINYSNLKETTGLGNIGSSKTAFGIEAHSAIAISEAGEVFGLLAQKLWTRPPEDFGKSDASRAKMPIEEKESYKWLETLESIGASFPEGTQVVHVCDREGDIYELFNKAEKEGHQYLCRRFHNRVIMEENGSKRLDDFVDALPEAGRISVHVPRDSHTNRKARNAEVTIKFGRCEIKKSDKLTGNKDLPKTIGVYVVSAVEINPPDGQEKIFWQLVTNVPTESFEDAVSRIAWYTQRWKIETFHRTLKSGCKVEELQSDSSDKLKKLIAVYSIIALEIMQLTYIARTHPDESCEICLTEDEWKILYRAANKTRKMPDKPPTIYEAVIMIAKLGGFLARKSDGFPGVTVIWRGLTSLYIVLDALPFLM